MIPAIPFSIPVIICAFKAIDDNTLGFDNNKVIDRLKTDKVPGIDEENAYHIGTLVVMALFKHGLVVSVKGKFGTETTITSQGHQYFNSLPRFE